MTDFRTVFEQYDWKETHDSILSKGEADVHRALQASKRSLEDFKALISPAARPFLETMVRQSRELTRKRFGNTIQMYSPMYLSNECQNICTYCGFSFTNKIARRTLTDAEILREVGYIKSKGYDHILLVTGEANRKVGVNYISNAIRLIRSE